MSILSVEVDAYLAVASKREVREYADRPLPDDVLTQILQAGRSAGSSKNTQPWRFIVLRDREHRHALAPSLMAPRNLDRCAVAVAVVLLNDRLRFDAGRVAQNMMVAAWALGVGSCPNSVRPDEHDRVREDLRLPAGAAIATVLTLGYPAPGSKPRPRPNAHVEKILARANRLPLEELTHRERFTS
jgi:nitroreductase